MGEPDGTVRKTIRWLPVMVAATVAVCVAVIDALPLLLGEASVPVPWMIAGALLAGVLGTILYVLLDRRLREWADFLPGIRPRVARVAGRSTGARIVLDNGLVLGWRMMGPTGSVLTIWRIFDRNGSSVLPNPSEALAWTRASVPWRTTLVGVYAPLRQAGSPAVVQQLAELCAGLSGGPPTEPHARPPSLRLEASWREMPRRAGGSFVGLVVVARILQVGAAISGPSFADQVDRLSAIAEATRMTLSNRASPTT